VVLVPVAVLVPAVPRAVVLVARPVAAQLLAVALQPVVQQQAVLPLRVVQQQQPVRQQLQPQPRLVWWQLVWRLWLWWLRRQLRKRTPDTPPLLPCLVQPPFTPPLASLIADLFGLWKKRPLVGRFFVPQVS
jgi:hypothetical protein